MKFRRLTQIFRSSLTRQLIGVFALTGFALITFISGIQIYSDNQRFELRVIEQLDEVGPSFLKPIAAAVWATNERETKLLLDAITWRTSIEYAAIIDGNRIISSAGNINSKNILERSYPIAFDQAGKSYALGTLYVVGGLDPVLQRVRENAIRVILYWSLMIFIFIAILFFPLHQRVIRHIHTISDYVRDLDLTQSTSLLSLQRRHRNHTDELDALIDAINEMHIFNRDVMAALHERENQIRLLMDSTDEGIYGVNTEGVCIFANTSAVRLLGYDSDSDLIGKNIHELIHHSYPDGTPYPKALCHVRQSTLHGKSTHVDTEVHWRRDGSSFPTEYRSQPIYIDGKIGGAVVTFIDTTERRRAEAERETLRTQLTQAQKMESIGHLTGGIAHDFNNMLGAMLGYSELLKQVCARSPGVPEQTSRYLNEILTAGHRAKELISQMLIFSRLGPEMQGQNSPVILLQPVIKEVVNMLRSSIPSNIQVNYHFPEETLRAQIQPVQLHQIILNLAINSRDAIQDYGEISISLSSYTAQGRCDSCHQPIAGNYLAIRVRDTGRGIPPEHLSKVFDPFFTTKDIGKGTGMGLSVVHGIVHSAGGHIEIHSTLQQGTEIRVLLPLVATPLTAATVTPTTTVTSQGNLSGLRIMVVDDEHAMATMLAELLQLQGAQVRMFTRPEEALATFENQPQAIDCLITDETMPQMTGLDLAKTVLQRRPELPIILITGYSEHVNEDIAKQHGITGFMYKPLNISGLIELVLRYTNHH